MLIDRIRYYPRAKSWFQTKLPAVAKNKKVWKAFLKYSELNQRDAKAALGPKTDPTVDFEIMQVKLFGELGHFNSDFPNKITLATQLLARFEKEHRLAKMQRLMEATVLHELCHWGDWRDNRQSGKEEGNLFEIAAYGKRVTKYW